MKEKIEELKERFKTRSTQENLIENLTKAIVYINSKCTDEEQTNQTKLKLLDTTLEFMRYNGLDFKQILPNSNYNYLKTFKTQIKRYYQTNEDETVFEELMKTYYQQDLQTMVRCRYEWNKERELFNKFLKKCYFLELRLNRSNTVKELNETLNAIINILEEHVANDTITDEVYEGFVIQLQEKADRIRKNITFGIQDTKQIVSGLKKTIKTYNKLNQLTNE